MEETTQYINLYDIEKRPGAGVELWGKAVALQYDRVVDANYRHRRSSEPGTAQEDKDPAAESQLHADVYFLALAIRRVLLFHKAVADLVRDDRLSNARSRFLARAGYAKDFRDYFEHLDEYLLGSGHQQRDGKVVGRVAPVLHLRWEADNVVVRFGERSMDVTVAAQAAIKLADETAGVWYEHMVATRPSIPEPPEADDGVERRLELTFGVSTWIGADEEPTRVATGTLLRVNITDADGDDVATTMTRPRGSA
jgi:hypothetical protein